MKTSKENAAESGARFKVDDQVRVRDMPYMFYTRTQMFTRGVVGTIASLTYKDLIPEEEAFNVDGKLEQFYIVRFRQKDLWPDTRSTTTHCKPSALIGGSNPQQNDGTQATSNKRRTNYMSHTHDEGNPGAETCHKAAPMVEEITDYEILEIAVRELAIEHGLFTAEDHRRFREFAESIGPAGGSRLVAKAWTDPAYKARVLADGTKACREIEIDWTKPTGSGTPSDYMNFRVLEDTPTLHHVIVCTLCSCYPRPLLGMSPECTAQLITVAG